MNWVVWFLLWGSYAVMFLGIGLAWGAWFERRRWTGENDGWCGGCEAEAEAWEAPAGFREAIGRQVREVMQHGRIHVREYKAPEAGAEGEAGERTISFHGGGGPGGNGAAGFLHATAGGGTGFPHDDRPGADGPVVGEHGGPPRPADEAGGESPVQGLEPFGTRHDRTVRAEMTMSAIGSRWIEDHAPGRLLTLRDYANFLASLSQAERDKLKGRV